MLLDDILDLLLLKLLELILLQVQTHLGPTSKRRIDSIQGNGESSTSSRLPDVLLVVVVLGNNLHLLRNEVGRVEPYTELLDHGDISAGGESLHEGLGVRLGNCAQVVDEVGFGHAHARITDGERASGLAGGDANVDIVLSGELRRVGEGDIADLVKGVRGVGDDFS